MPAVIGRDPNTAIHLSHAKVSRNHAVIEERGGTLYIRDLGSSNGTERNGVRIQSETRLTAGDTIGVGPFQITWVGEKQPTPRPPKPPTRTGPTYVRVLSLMVGAWLLVMVGGIYLLNQVKPDGRSVQEQTYEAKWAKLRNDAKVAETRSASQALIAWRKLIEHDPLSREAREGQHRTRQTLENKRLLGQAATFLRNRYPGQAIDALLSLPEEQRKLEPGKSLLKKAQGMLDRELRTALGQLCVAPNWTICHATALSMARRHPDSTVVNEAVRNAERELSADGRAYAPALLASFPQEEFENLFGNDAVVIDSVRQGDLVHVESLLAQRGEISPSMARWAREYIKWAKQGDRLESRQQLEQAAAALKQAYQWSLRIVPPSLENPTGEKLAERINGLLGRLGNDAVGRGNNAEAAGYLAQALRYPPDNEARRTMFEIDDRIAESVRDAIASGMIGTCDQVQSWQQATLPGGYAQASARALASSACGKN